MAPVPVTQRVREAHPELATVIDSFNALVELYDAQTELVANLRVQREVLSNAILQLRAENDSLRAMLKAKGGAAC